MRRLVVLHHLRRVRTSKKASWLIRCLVIRMDSLLTVFPRLRLDLRFCVVRGFGSVFSQIIEALASDARSILFPIEVVHAERP
jgi:hypothetical protein